LCWTRGTSSVTSTPPPSSRHEAARGQPLGAVRNRRQDLEALGEWIGIPLLEGDAALQYILRRTFANVNVKQPSDSANHSISHAANNNNNNKPGPSLVTNIIRLKFGSRHEADLYSHLSHKHAAKAQDILERGSKNVAAMEVLLRMRQTCVHPTICIKGMQKKRLYNPQSMDHNDAQILREYSTSCRSHSHNHSCSTKFNHIVNSVSEFCDKNSSGKVLIFL